jgi:hypothetical protein
MIDLRNPNGTIGLRPGNEKASQAAHCQPGHQTQAHEAACCLALFRINPLGSGDHARASKIPVGQTKEHLHDDEIENVAVDNGSEPADVAEMIQTNPRNAQRCQQEDDLRPVDKG